MGNEIAGVRYIKLEDHPVLAKMSRIQRDAPDSIGIFGGLGGMYFLEELQRGSRGIMTGFAWPEVLVAVYQAFRAGDVDRAAAIFDRYVPLIRYEFQPKIGLAYRKHVYRERGIIDTTFIRPPGMQIDDYTRAELTAVIRRVGFDPERAGVQPVDRRRRGAVFRSQRHRRAMEDGGRRRHQGPSRHERVRSRLAFGRLSEQDPRRSAKG